MIIYLKNGRGEAVVDEDDYDYLAQFPWFFSSGYATTSKRVDGKIVTFSMHRVVMNAPAGMVVDHINHDRLDNRKRNLRIVTVAENNRNLSPRKEAQPTPRQPKPARVPIIRRTVAAPVNEPLIAATHLEELLTVEEACAYLVVKPSALFRFMDHGLCGIKLAYVYVGARRRTTQRALEQFIQAVSAAPRSRP